MKRLLPALVVLLCLTSLACQSRISDRWVVEEPRPATLDQLIARWGSADQMLRDGDDRVYAYFRNRARGTRYGLTPLGTIWGLATRHTVREVVWVRVGPDGRVKSLRPVRAHQEPQYDLWPFSD